MFPAPWAQGHGAYGVERCNQSWKVLRNAMNMKRPRGRNYRNNSGGGGGGGGGSAPRSYSGNIPLNRNHVFDSSGPDLRIRGTAQQLFEKYLQLGRDATGSGDRVMAESYFQYAEHYFRIVSAINQAAQQSQPQQHYQAGGQPPPPQGNHQNGQRRQANEDYQPEEDQSQGYNEQGQDQPLAAEG
jgi:hypothetical protein